MQLQQYRSKCWLARTCLAKTYMHVHLCAPVYTLLSLERAVVCVSWSQLICKIAKLARHAALAAATHCIVIGANNMESRPWNTTILRPSSITLTSVRQDINMPFPSPLPFFFIDDKPTPQKHQACLTGPPDADLFPSWQGVPPQPQCYNQPGSPGAHPALLPCQVFLRTEKCSNAGTQPLSTCLPSLSKHFILSGLLYLLSTADLECGFQSPTNPDLLTQKWEDPRGFWRCLVFSFKGGITRSFQGHPAGAGGSQSAPVHFISS